MKTQPPLTTLDYATPQPLDRDPNWEVGAVFGILAALAGLIMLYAGATGVLWLVCDWNQADRQDIAGIVICNLIWIVCAWAAYRWIPHRDRED